MKLLGAPNSSTFPCFFVCLSAFSVRRRLLRTNFFSVVNDWWMQLLRIQRGWRFPGKSKIPGVRRIRDFSDHFPASFYFSDHFPASFWEAFIWQGLFLTNSMASSRDFWRAVFVWKSKKYRKVHIEIFPWHLSVWLIFSRVELRSQP